MLRSPSIPCSLSGRLALALVLLYTFATLASGFVGTNHAWPQTKLDSQQTIGSRMPLLCAGRPALHVLKALGPYKINQKGPPRTGLLGTFCESGGGASTRDGEVSPEQGAPSMYTKRVLYISPCHEHFDFVLHSTDVGRKELCIGNVRLCSVPNRSLSWPCELFFCPPDVRKAEPRSVKKTTCIVALRNSVPLRSLQEFRGRSKCT